jgi:phosphoribosylpyrophosphate synthetase
MARRRGALPSAHSGTPFAFSSSSSSSSSSARPSSSPQYAALGLLSLAGAALCGLGWDARCAAHAKASKVLKSMEEEEDHDDQLEPSGRARPTKKKRKQRHLKLFAGNGNRKLARKIGQHLQVPLGKCTIGKFSDGETRVEFHENVRGDSCYVVQSTCTPVNDNIMELLLMISGLRRASAKYITAVIPYYGYKRDVGTGHNISHSQREALNDYHDARAEKGGETGGEVSDATSPDVPTLSEAIVPVSSAEVATMLEAMGVDRVISVDLQPPGKGQIEGFFGTRVPVDSIQGTFAGVEYFRNRISDRVVVVAPNETCVKKAEHMQAGLRGSGYRWRDGALRKMKVGLALCIVGSDISEESRYHFNRPSGDAKSNLRRNPSNTSPLDHARRAAEKSEVTVVGDVENCDVIIVDDLISSGGTVVTRARQVRRRCSA